MVHNKFEKLIVLEEDKTFDYVYHLALEKTLLEWNSSKDDEAYNDL